MLNHDGAIGEPFEGYLWNAEVLLFKEVPIVVQEEKNTRVYSLLKLFLYLEVYAT